MPELDLRTLQPSDIVGFDDPMSMNDYIDEWAGERLAAVRTGDQFGTFEERYGTRAKRFKKLWPEVEGLARRLLSAEVPIPGGTMPLVYKPEALEEFERLGQQIERTVTANEETIRLASGFATGTAPVNVPTTEEPKRRGRKASPFNMTLTRLVEGLVRLCGFSQEKAARYVAERTTDVWSRRDDAISPTEFEELWGSTVEQGSPRSNRIAVLTERFKRAYKQGRKAIANP